jgi:hypothetical protein
LENTPPPSRGKCKRKRKKRERKKKIVERKISKTEVKG